VPLPRATSVPTDPPAPMPPATITAMVPMRAQGFAGLTGGTTAGGRVVVGDANGNKLAEGKVHVH